MAEAWKNGSWSFKKSAVMASGLCLSALLLRCGGGPWWGCWLVIGLISCYALRTGTPPRLKDCGRGELAAAAVLSLAYLYYFAAYLPGHLGGAAQAPGWAGAVLAVMSAYAMLLLVLWAMRAALRLLEAPLRRVAHAPLWWLFVLMGLAILLCYTQTTLFYRPEQEGNLMLYDRLFTSDTGALVEYNAWLDIACEENDFRQPLFAVFALPVSIPLYLLGQLLSFFPDFYIFAMAGAQWALLVLGFGMVTELCGLGGREGDGLMLTLAVSYPTLIFMLNMEQYIFAVFWMLCFLYAALTGRGGRKLLFAAATGSMLTTGFWFPLISGKPWKQWLTQVAQAAGLMALLWVACGKLELFEVLGRQVGRYGEYMSAPLTLWDKALQYLNFVGSCLIAPHTVVNDPNGKFMLAQATGVNLFGVALLILAVTGMALYWVKPFIRACAAWAGFSFVLLCLIGWGTAENGLILYTHYFNWAFIAPAYLAVRRMTARLGRWRGWVLAACGLVILALNGLNMLELLRFARRVYPR